MTIPPSEFYAALKPIANIPEANRHYFASSDGKIYCLREVKGQRANRSGYRFVRIYGKGTNICKTTHSLVALAFIGPRPHKLVINHKDGNKLNNSADNLEYISHQDNVIHSWRLGLSKKLSLEHYRSIHLKKFPSTRTMTDEQALSLIAEYRSGGVSMQTLADRHQIPKTTICNIINGKVCYKELPR